MLTPKESTISEQIRHEIQRVKVLLEDAEVLQIQLFLADQNITVDLDLKISLWEDTVYVARSSDLGLTAYGPDPDAAKASFTALFNRFAKAHHSRGSLETVLNKTGLTWTYKLNDEVE